VTVTVLFAADGARWEAAWLADIESTELRVARRCMDVVELLAVAATGQAQAAVVDAGLRRLDVDAVDRLHACGVTVVGVVDAEPGRAEEMLRAVGIEFQVPADAPVQVVTTVVEAAVVANASGAGAATRDVASRAFAEPSFTTVPVETSSFDGSADLAGPSSGQGAVAGRRGSVVAVWGPTGAPGRTTVAVGVADELSRLQLPTTLVDADVYGGVVASTLGLLDESAGVAAACRQAQSRRLDAAAFAGLAWQVNPLLRVLTGLTRADRWPELRPQSMQDVLSVARQVADYTIVDVGFALETDEELSFDTVAPRRNGATLAVLDEADLVLAVGSADPIGIQRLARGMSELREAEIAAPVWIVLNRVRRVVVPGDPVRELDRALQRFVGQAGAAFLPLDVAAVDGSGSTGRTLAEFAPGSALRRAIRDLAMAVGGMPSKPRGRRRR
jgi:Flp pilus assembly CpaE family ATPase